MNDLETLPLFPLNTVIFPYAQLQLHIFEPRYAEMVQTCLEIGAPFGIVLARSAPFPGVDPEPYLVGTAVKIVSRHPYDDGRMDIQVKGERRFRIREIDDSHSFLVGKVEPVVEQQAGSDYFDPATLARARECCLLYLRKRFETHGFDIDVMFPPDPVDLSFTIASLLNITNLQKQQMLETVDTMDRLETLLPILERQLEELESPAYFKMSADMILDDICRN